jgi:hypothetical protein
MIDEKPIAALPHTIVTYHKRSAAHFRELAEKVTTNRIKGQILKRAEQHERLAVELHERLADEMANSA